MNTSTVLILLIIVLITTALYTSLIKKQEEKKKKRSLFTAPHREEFSLELTPPEKKEKKRDRESEKKEERDFLRALPHLPYSYGKEVLVAMVRDPRCIFCYWDYGPQFTVGEPLLQLIDITGMEYQGHQAQSRRSIPISLQGKNFYIMDCLPDREYVVELGYFQHEHFYPLIRSNVVHTPRDYPSEELEGNWMVSKEIFESSMFLTEDVGRTVGLVDRIKKRREREMASPEFPWGRSDS